MPIERCRVVLQLHGAEQFYQRDEVIRGRDGNWVTRPFFVTERQHSITMSELVARAFVNKIRSLGNFDPWIEDAKDGRRIEVPHEDKPQSGEDNREPMIATLDDTNWYIVRPCCTPHGRQWFITMVVPGRPERETIYANSELDVLRRAEDMGFLRFAEKFQRPEPPPQQAATTSRGWRRRPGDVR